MKKLLLLTLFISAAFMLNAQVRIGFLGGANRSDIIETNNLPIKLNYKPKYGYHGGMLAEFSLNKKGSLAFQPNVTYYNKGRELKKTFEPGTSTLLDSSVKQSLNYIDIPLHLIAKIKLVKKLKFIIGAGPYASFYLSGRDKA